ncbi:DUF1178 family protein [Ideonella sp.]|uniref:DUF1178 family protein n=1 Tax=Ideonella sp. TaxID=1929293 RepID=UPI002B49B1CD|nr:DUF1178 family protein [Ideonella sp.]HJV71600.1 DUF1178 family protein [Ideonella sp.]
MKVLDLRCAHGHGFEGWFASEDDFLQQHERGLVECPLCGDKAVSRLPSAPRLNFGAQAPREAAAPAPPAAPPGQAMTLQSLWVEAVKHVMARTEDVGERFPEEARRIHYGEAESRGIRGQATPEERAALEDEGIEVVALPVPPALKGPAH